MTSISPGATADDLPGTFQLTYLPSTSMFALWGVEELPDIDTGAGRGEVDLAIPVRINDEIVVAPRTVQAVLLDPATALLALNDIDPALVGASLRQWTTVLELLEQRDTPAQEDAALPTAAHCELIPGHASIRPAHHVLSELATNVKASALISASEITASLRPYQHHGVSWLMAQSTSQAGAVLADEMGLGKTLQAICLLAARRRNGPHLVVCPTSVLGNWQREIEKFAPHMAAHRYHSPSRRLPEQPPVGTIVITSYSTARSDHAMLARFSWDVIVLDEAQQLKNPDTRISQAIRSLPAAVKIAMTGTPVENRLDELWSLMNITNPGVLGNRTTFARRFGTPIEQHRSATAAARLAAITSTHVLRRTKSQVAPELPPKQHSQVACTLTDEQRDLYQTCVDAAFEGGLGAGAGRRGNVLSLLTALKQICNHPAQYLKDHGPYAGRSGKLDRLTEMIDEADEADRFLVFTQYRRTGELLTEHLADQRDFSVPFLHGGLNAGQRDELVHQFQEIEDGPPILILSLRAAGFGINLTRANNVVHFDRWWNPAVEDQATDRAHRIGQRRTLNVYSLVTEGTLEDHIGNIHRVKKGLAGLVSGNPEAALAALPDDELYEIVRLDKEL